MFGLGDKDKDKEKADEKPPEQQAAKASSGAGGENPKEEPGKTTPDEGKTFSADTVFVCVQDCFQKGVRRRRGDELTGKVCPPWFIVKPKEAEGEKNKK